MQFGEYQKKSRATAIYPDIGNNFVYPVLGMAGETGEVAEKVKKLIRDASVKSAADISPEKRAELEKEIGDVLWYMAQLCSELSVDFDTVASNNLEKVLSRKERDVIHGEGGER